MSPQARPAEIPALTGLRAVLAWWVAVYHLTIAEVAPLPAGLLEPLRANGYLAVDGFFILSGFILAYVYRARFADPAPGEYRRFLVARLARIYPVHLAMTLLVVAMLGAAVLGAGFQARVAERFSLRELVLHLSLLHAWGFSRMLAWNYPSWSISAEWAAYLAFPLVHRAVLRGEGTVRPALIAAFLVAALAVFEQVGPNSSLSYTYEFALVRIGLEFPLGACLLMLARPWLERPVAGVGGGRPHGALALLAAAASVFVLPDAATVACLAAAILALSHPGDALGRFLGHRLGIYAGETSYAVYMTHAIIQGVAIIAIRAVPALAAIPGWLRLLGLCLVVQVAAHIVYAAIEKPARGWVRRLGERGFARRAAAEGRP